MKYILKFSMLFLAFSMFFASYAKDNDVTPTEPSKVEFGAVPDATIITTGTVEVITEDNVRYHVIVANVGGVYTVTMVESEIGVTIVDFGPAFIPNFGTEIKAYADAIRKPMSAIVTHDHGDHYGNIDKFPNTKIYAEETIADILKTDANFTALYSDDITKVTTSETIHGFAFTFDKISQAETGENGYVYIEETKAIFLADLVYNKSHNYIREYTPLTAPDEPTNWIKGLNSLKATFGDYKHVFVGHNGTRTDVATVINENITYLSDAQGLIKGTKQLTAGGTASTVLEVVNELEILYPSYVECALKLSLPDAFYPGDPGSVWF
jgi:glyoxylase-like metal-dependent hydrolase (beta-lactamase superfamily II)